jgi:DNA-binding NarL/FixJ family response regulator
LNLDAISGRPFRLVSDSDSLQAWNDQGLKISMAHAIALPEASEVIRVLAADSTRMNSQLLAAALERDKRFQVLEPTVDSRMIVATVLQERPAVVLISAGLDDDPRKGFQVARELNAVRAESRIVMLLDSSERALIVEAFRAGARGVFCRSESLKSLAKCIQCVGSGQIWANSNELRFLLEALGETMPLRTNMPSRGAGLLSRREQEVVRCVAEGLSNREIAQRLTLTEHTVKNYLFRILTSLGFRSGWKSCCSLTVWETAVRWNSIMKTARRTSPRPGKPPFAPAPLPYLASLPTAWPDNS